MLNADVMRELGTYGPRRFEFQTKSVRRRGRKGLALLDRGKRRKTKARRRAHMTSASSGRDYRELLREFGAYGGGGSRRRKSKRRKSSGRSARSSGMTRRQRRKMNRQLARSRRTTRKGSYRASGRSRKASRRGTSRRSRKSTRSVTRRSRRSSGRSRKSTRSLSRRGASRVLTYNSLMKTLRKGKRRGKKRLQAWVCVGRKRTGCGGGRKGRRGSRQLGVLRP